MVLYLFFSSDKVNSVNGWKKNNDRLNSLSSYKTEFTLTTNNNYECCE